MSTSTSGRTWDEASAPGATRLARRFENDWRASTASHRPEPTAYLPAEPGSCPGARLALLRAEMNLRAEDGEAFRVEVFRQRYDDLSEETLVALIYEEFCLREEAGEIPELREYESRFPDVRAPLRRVFDIHGLIGSSPESLLDLPTSNVPAVFPESGQTIAGFHLVSELGRGAFARVFLAEERQLADRPVALKVARNGSREPSTLARLQHTHIVPIYSYRTDPATGLHLLCMPYLGGVTLAELFSDKQVRNARTGSDLLKVLDRHEPSPNGRAGGASGREALRTRSYVRAIAWWGARLAEALAHAHERGVLHRDVKPSNILVTSDGLPMLLDFNLAWEHRLDDPALEPAALGGTLAYMAPEHLEALADGVTGAVDARSDIYALGVVLFEAMGSRPFAPPLSAAGSFSNTLLRAADERRIHTPSLAEEQPDIPIEFDAVVAKCMAPDPTKRYANAHELSADLQAIADDAPLRTARIPLVYRTSGWVRRRRAGLAVGATLLFVAVVLGVAAVKAQFARVDQLNRANAVFAEGKNAVALGDFALAMNKFETASKLCEHWNAPLLVDLFHRSREQYRLAEQTLEVRDRADTLFARAEKLRYGLLGLYGRPADSFEETIDTLEPFFVLESPVPWTERADMRLLNQSRKTRLIATVDDLLFLWSVARFFPYGRERLGMPPTGEDRLELFEVCDRAIAFSPDPSPWRALRRLAETSDSGDLQERSARPRLASVQSPLACFHWASLSLMEKRPAEAVSWLERGARLDPNNYWIQYYLSHVHANEQNDSLNALSHIEAAIALRPSSDLARFERAKLEFSRGQCSRALDDLETCLKLMNQGDASRLSPHERNRRAIPVRLMLGRVHQALGEVISSREYYNQILRATKEDDRFHAAASLNSAKLDADAGGRERAIAHYDALLQRNPRDLDARRGRAIVSLRLGDAASAQQDVAVLLKTSPSDPALLALQARAALMLGELTDARESAGLALIHSPDPSNRRLVARIELARGAAEKLILDSPEEFDSLPGSPIRLRHDLERILHRPPPSSLDGQLQRAVILSVLGRQDEARRLATKLIDDHPSSSVALRIRAGISFQCADWDSARLDLDRALELEPNNVKLRLFSGRVHARKGRKRAAFLDLDRAIAGGAGAGPFAERARLWMEEGQWRLAIQDWNRAVELDVNEPAYNLGLAECLRELGSPREACAQLQYAADRSEERPAAWAALTAQTARICLRNPGRLPLLFVYCNRWLESKQR